MGRKEAGRRSGGGKRGMWLKKKRRLRGGKKEDRLKISFQPVLRAVGESRTHTN